jgi:hypothetical protein
MELLFGFIIILLAFTFLIILLIGKIGWTQLYITLFVFFSLGVVDIYLTYFKVKIRYNQLKTEGLKNGSLYYRVIKNTDLETGELILKKELTWKINNKKIGNINKK